jgi:hypothetical protein
MTLPTVPVTQIRLGTGASFGDPLILGDALDGILGTNVLASSAIEVVDVSSTVQRISIRQGRDRLFEEYLPGEAIIQFLDTTGDWNPANASSPYYGQVKPMRQVQIKTTYSGTAYYLFSGYITSWDYTWADQSVDYAIVTLQCVDGFRLLSLANIDTVAGAATNDLPGERINQILDAVDWPATQRNIDPGDTLLENDPGGLRSALSAIQNVQNSDLGAFFIDNDGKATYYSRNTLSIKAAGTAYEFDDNGTNIQYQAIDVAYDDQELANQVTFTRDSGTPQTVSDSASIDEYFLRSFVRSGLYIKDNSTTLARANQVLNYRKEVRMRIDSFSLDLSSVSNRVTPALAIGIGDPVVLTKNMAGGTDLTLRLSVQGHSHDITPERWITSFTTAYPLGTAFILGSTEFGVWELIHSKENYGYLPAFRGLHRR